MPHFLHTADWQIGRQYGQFESDDAARLAAARLNAVGAIAEQGARLAVDAILVAGDVFEMQTVTDKILHRTFQSMAGYGGLWILLPGNHDAALADSVWSRARDYGLVGGNVHLLDRAEPALFEEQGFVVLPAPLTQRQTADDVTRWFDDAPAFDGLVRIGLAHGSVTERLPEAAQAGNPIAVDRADRSGLDYLALGDWHGCLQVGPRTWYAGSPETDRFRANDSGHVLEVTIDKAGSAPQVVRHKTGRHDWHRLVVELRDQADLETLRFQLDPLGSRDVVRLKLSGQLGWQDSQALDKMLALAGARLAALDVEREPLNLIPNEEEIAHLRADGYLGDVLSDLRAQLADGEPVDTLSDDGLAVVDALTLLSETLIELRASPRGKAL